MQIVNASRILVEKLGQWLEGLIALLPNLVIGLLVLALFGLVARWARRATGRAMDKVTDYPTVGQLMASLAYVVVWAAGLFMALRVLNLTGVVATLLAGAGIIGLAVGFAFQDITTNFIAGVLLTVRRPFTTGDRIETAGHTGTAEELNLRSTILRTPQGQKVFIPNKEVFENPLTNYSDGSARRVDLRCGVSYEDDLAAVRQEAIGAVKQIDLLDEERPVQLFYEEFGGSSINFVLRFWIQSVAQPDFLAARSEAIERIKSAFDEAGIDIPYPIRTLDLPDPLSIGEQVRGH